MGIRYYAYAFDASMTEFAMAHPRALVGGCPCAELWWMEREVPAGSRSRLFDPSEADCLDLDKAWSDLQRMTGRFDLEEAPRPAHAMFTGSVTWTDRGYLPWVAVIPPAQVAAIAEDLVRFRQEVEGTVHDEYVREYLSRAVEFAAHVALTGRGFAYSIG